MRRTAVVVRPRCRGLGMRTRGCGFTARVAPPDTSARDGRADLLRSTTLAHRATVLAHTRVDGGERLGSGASPGRPCTLTP